MQPATDTTPASPRPCPLVDTHCHLDMIAEEQDLAAVLARAAAQGVERIVSIGIDLESSAKAVALAKKYRQLAASIGVHPHAAETTSPADYARLEQLYAENRDEIVAYGEIGLDYVKGYSDPASQRVSFARQLDLAHTLGLPVIIHNREADADTLTLLRRARPLGKGGIMHCFSGDLDFAAEVLDLGLLVSIPGVVTFKNALTLQQVVREIPLQSLVLETDAPFLAPHPHRGRPNEPAYLRHTAERVAQLRGLDLATLATATTANAARLFSWDTNDR